MTNVQGLLSNALPRRITRALALLCVLVVGLWPLSVFAQEALTETYEDDLVTFMYPDGWTVCDCPPSDPVAIIGSSRAVTNSTDPSDFGDDVQVVVIKSFATFFEVSGNDLPAFDDSVDLLESLTNESARTLRGVDDGAYVLIDARDADRLWVATLLENGEVGGLLATTQSGEMSQHEDTVLEIARTLQSVGQGGGGDEGLLFEGDGFSFSYPEDWAVEERENGQVMLANSERALSSLRRSGDVQVLFYISLETLIDNELADDTDVVDLAERLFPDNDTFDFGRPRSITLGEYDAAFVEQTNLETGGEGIMYVIDRGDGDFMLASFLAPEGEFEDSRKQVEQVLSTLQFGGGGGGNNGGGATLDFGDLAFDPIDADELTQRIRTGDYQMFITEDWFGTEDNRTENAFLIATDEDLLGQFDISGRRQGSFMIYPTLDILGLPERMRVDNLNSGALVSIYAITAQDNDGYVIEDAIQVGEVDRRDFAAVVTYGESNEWVAACIATPDGDDFSCAIGVTSDGYGADLLPIVAAALASLEAR
jgi:hypothetical protein